MYTVYTLKCMVLANPTAASLLPIRTQVVARIGWQPEGAWMDALLEQCVVEGRLSNLPPTQARATPVALLAALAFARYVLV